MAYLDKILHWYSINKDLGKLAQENVLNWEITIFCKELDNKCLMYYLSYGFCPNCPLCSCNIKTVIANLQVKECSRVLIQLYFWKGKF